MASIRPKAERTKLWKQTTGAGKPGDYDIFAAESVTIPRGKSPSPQMVRK